MRAIMIMYDTLCRHYLPPYGNEWVQAPNFSRLAEKSLCFDNCYIGSMPCMPARRELHTGRHNFLHRSWGPIEPFDDSMPWILREHGIHTHLTTDHYHYWEDGGSTYHNRYSTYGLYRGQEGDAWKGVVQDPQIPDHAGDRSGPDHAGDRPGRKWRQDWINRTYMQEEQHQPQAKTFADGLNFMQTNKNDDNWFLQIETFDPHEPFFTQQHFKDLYPQHFDEYNGRHFDWPDYREVRESDDEVAHLQFDFAALVSMCDKYLGRVLDLMDEQDMWQDTMLIVNTDHGYLLGEHDYWGKSWCPYYQEVAHIPLFIYDPRSGKSGERRKALVQNIDLAPTILDFFDIPVPDSMEGVPLMETLSNDQEVRDAAIFGLHGGHVNITDGRYVYMRGAEHADNKPLFNYTVMPTHLGEFFSMEELSQATLHDGFDFTKGCKLLRTASPGTVMRKDLTVSRLYDLETDYEQRNPIIDMAVEHRLCNEMVKLMRQNDAPPEQYERLGLESYL